MHLFSLCAVGGAVSITVQVFPKVLNVTIDQTANLGCSFLTNQPMNNLMVQWTLYPWSSETPLPVSSVSKHAPVLNPLTLRYWNLSHSGTKTFYALVLKPLMLWYWDLLHSGTETPHSSVLRPLTLRYWDLHRVLNKVTLLNNNNTCLSVYMFYFMSKCGYGLIIKLWIISLTIFFIIIRCFIISLEITWSGRISRTD